MSGVAENSTQLSSSPSSTLDLTPTTKLVSTTLDSSQSPDFTSSRMSEDQPESTRTGPTDVLVAAAPPPESSSHPPSSSPSPPHSSSDNHSSTSKKPPAPSSSSHPPSPPASSSSSHAPSTTTQVTTQKGQTLTSTSTSTAHPSSSEPAMVTVFSTVTEPNSVVVTITHVTPSPTASLDAQAATEQSGFFHNRGAVAGVFVVVGVLILSLLLCAIVMIRRRRRSDRQARWFSGLRPRSPSDDDSLRDPARFAEKREEMTSRSTTSVNDQRSYGSHHQNDRPVAASGRQITRTVAAPQQFRHNEASGLGGLGVPFDDRYPPFEPIPPLGFVDHQRPPLSARSSPSIYPASLPADKEESRWGQRELAPPMIVSSNPPPPRPPRSQLRELVSRNGRYTRPRADSTPTHSEPPSPLFDHITSTTSDDSRPSISSYKKPSQDVLSRKTLLDVRPRPGTRSEEAGGYNHYLTAR
ncbi:hypothetical protein BDN72DRAFT_890901 [Pluteus cervinus]|uniref:Uncharacterized protein n=1 Tax=Pluteus cervinus TaxID=181527 RepID=A0ACD3BG80_9AGAR|nr:hypothetical protein BDN72DRAFT_890901 [Pluteus cervinus]